MHIRRMSEQDIDFALSLTAAEGWLSTRQDFEDLLEFDPEAHFIAEIDNDPIGMVGTVPYNDFGYVGNLIVLEKHRGKKLGTALMDFALNNLEDRGVKTQLLDGVPDAVSLYERFGFRKVCRSLRLEGMVEPRESEQVRHLTEVDLEQIYKFDSKHFGAPRHTFLRSLLNHFPRLCWVLENNSEIQGYIMGSERKDSIRIGPWVMVQHSDQAEDLLASFATETSGQVLKIGVLETCDKAVHLLEKNDFVETSHSWRMIRGADGDWTTSDHLYAICSPARG
jgi:ribosomal protein S18 acetylase RimI-like enzyme